MSRKAARDKVDPKPRRVKAKFQEERQEHIKNNPIKALNEEQDKYIKALENPSKQIILALGYAGTGKTMLATVLGCDKFRMGELQGLLFSRPAISSSKSVGFLPGSATEKMQVWLQPVMQNLRDRIGNEALEIALKREDVSLIPLEVVKGLSLENQWLIVDEASDLTKAEVIKLVTRVGRNSKVVLCGDVNQKELKEESGLAWFARFALQHNMQDFVEVIDFNKTEHIVRSTAVKRIIVALAKEGYYSI